MIIIGPWLKINHAQHGPCWDRHIAAALLCRVGVRRFRQVGNDDLAVVAILEKPTNRAAQQGSRRVPADVLPGRRTPVGVQPLHQNQSHWADFLVLALFLRQG